MKSIEEIEAILGNEIRKSLNQIRNRNAESSYYNDILGYTASTLAALLYVHLKEGQKNWESNKWVDDILIRWVESNGDLKLRGIIIWGKRDTTEQWTEPIYFETSLDGDKVSMKKYVILFGDKNRSEITYEDFHANQDYWDQAINEWRHIIVVKKE